VAWLTREAFLSLCENRPPASGKRLTQRHKTARIDKAGGGESANRRVFFDFTISPPKSVSIAALVVGDLRIVAAHREALCAAVSELEGFASARVRECGANRDRRTDNIVAALFEHETSRALDPHLHTHCIVFNATQDAEDGRWKALQNHDMLAAQKYVENVYYHELARALRVLGYTVVNSPRGDFEIAEVPEALRARFSKRHAQIDAQTATMLEEHPELHGANVQAIREYLAHKKRDRKVRGVSPGNLRAFWAEQLSVAEREALHPSTCHAAPFCKESAVEALDWAEAHLFERRSVVHKHELWRHALAKTRGSDVTVAELKRETEARSYLRAEQDKISRRGVLAREWAIVEMARDGIGRYSPLGRSYLLDANELASDQLRAFRQILRSRDFITLFRGGAGTGKSFVLRRIQDALRLARHVTKTAAPQRQQLIDLDRNGLQDVQTVPEFIQRGVLPQGAVVIVDEAGQIGGQQMFDLLRLVKGANGRVILSGDTRQHGPVEASDALRAIERYSGLRPIQLDQIRRQDPARARKAEERERVTIYRQAVEAASAGDLVTSLEHLERLGAVKECGIGEQRERLIEAYVGFAARGETAIVVSQTRAEVRAINEAVRAGLRRCGALTGADTSVTALEQVDLTTAQKADTRHYPAES
jgi:conjugative relaxase-like TrwC/TraI family protein